MLALLINMIAFFRELALIMRIHFLVLFLILSSFSDAQTLMHSHEYQDPFLPGIINLKIRSSSHQQDVLTLQRITDLLKDYGLVNLKKKFPHAESPRTTFNALGEAFANISTIYRAEFPEVANLKNIIYALHHSGLVEYAEPHFIPRTCYVPNDDSLNNQYALFLINAFAAWDISKSDTGMLIGVTDTGYDPFHPDLNGNIQRNYADPVNGKDDDKDGFTDNFMGWDTGEDDNDPTVDASSHGIHVTGLCCAVNDNKIGMAGTGFRSRFIHIKIADKKGILTAAYEGVVYAADHGCKVINCSWGGNQFSKMNRDIIRYAAINKNCVVICGAGNDNNDISFYPASYEYTLSVGSTDAKDTKVDFSNYGYDLDLVAPGDYLLSTWENGGYLRSGGTSMSAPLVAGAAAMLRSALPEWNSRQICEQLKITCDQVDTLSSNSQWKGLLGAGRLNMLKAITQTGNPAIVLNDIKANGKKNNLFFPGDTIVLGGLLVNYLSAANAVNIELSCNSPSVEIINPIFNAGSMPKLKAIPLYDQPFLIKINASAGINEKLVFRLRSNADGFQRDQYFYLSIFGDFINVETSVLKTSFGSQGSVGVSGDNFIEGLGFQYGNNKDMLYEGGLMVGKADQIVLDNVRGTSEDSLQLFTAEVLKRVAPFDGTVEQYRGKLLSGVEAFPLSGEQRVLVSKLPEHKNFVIVEYLLTNTSQQVYDGLKAGLFCDWDLADPGKNKAEWNNALKLGFVHTVPNDSLYAAVQSLTEGAANYYALDNIPGGAGGIDATDGFNKDEKYRTLTESKLIAGGSVSGTDVITITSGPAFSIPPGGSTRVAFALLGASSKNELYQSALNALLFYSQTGLPLSFNDHSDERWRVYPNPASGKVYIEPVGTANDISLELLDISGRTLPFVAETSSGGIIQASVSGLSEGVYFLKIVEEGRVFLKRLVIGGSN